MEVMYTDVYGSASTRRESAPPTVRYGYYVRVLLCTFKAGGTVPYAGVDCRHEYRTITQYRHGTVRFVVCNSLYLNPTTSSTRTVYI